MPTLLTRSRRRSGSFCAWCENNNWGVFLLLAPHSDTKWRRLTPKTPFDPAPTAAPPETNPAGQTMHVQSTRIADQRTTTVCHTHQTASNFSIELNPSFSLIKATTSEPSNRLVHRMDKDTLGRTCGNGSGSGV
ncbi:uncharacterized protein Dyak_GE27563 [Drosophila yakuba]|uniref:Uncharacterized protein n=1 Tax=Drosophila yakuba TaxID=7245 RepID=A0A0R1E146_DROYA|nr:uncharacterized protein Dyak_GE27563 [Drosophila yakuba]